MEGQSGSSGHRAAGPGVDLARPAPLEAGQSGYTIPGRGAAREKGGEGGVRRQVCLVGGQGRRVQVRGMQRGDVKRNGTAAD